jgi:DNA-binding GntR family transcriptional regulator
VQRRGRHSLFRPAPPAPARSHLLHTFELAAVLEAHAVSRAAATQNPDLQATHAALAQLARVVDTRNFDRWAGFELQFHRALDDQAGNLVLASLAERTLRDGLTACPIPSPEVLTILQSQHRDILRCVEARDAETAACRARGHMFYLRDMLVSAVPGATHGGRIRLHT